MKSCYITKCRS